MRQAAWFVSFMFVICGGFRLARFNVQASRPRPLAEGTPKVDKRYGPKTRVNKNCETTTETERRAPETHFRCDEKTLGGTAQKVGESVVVAVVISN